MRVSVFSCLKLYYLNNNKTVFSREKVYSFDLKCTLYTYIYFRDLKCVQREQGYLRYTEQVYSF